MFLAASVVAANPSRCPPLSQIKDLFTEYRKTTDISRKAVLANTIIREIAVHSEAEEITVYNALGKQDDKSSQHFRDEHQALEELLYSLDYTKTSDPEFDPSE